MPRRKHTSPRLAVDITDARRDSAIASNSGGCLIADAIKDKYPEFTGITVDMATIRVTDRAAGERYTYLTPPQGQHILLAFDQGWPNPGGTVDLKRAVKITPIREKSSAAPAIRAQKIATYKQAAASGAITPAQKGALARMERQPERPVSTGKATVHVRSDGSAIIIGGSPLKTNKSNPNLLSGNNRTPESKRRRPAAVATTTVATTAAATPSAAVPAVHPNLLHGHDRHFGAKIANPGKAFNEAVEQRVAERLAEATTV